MTHLSDDELVLMFYGEGGGLPGAEAHVSGCQACRTRFESLASELGGLGDAPVPERDESYGALVWERLKPRLDAEPRHGWREAIAAALSGPRLAMAGAAALLVAAAFVAGRLAVEPAPSSAPIQTAQPAAGEVPDQDGERAMFAAVGQHLERSYVVLAEIATRNGDGAPDAEAERETAADLAAANRLYRAAAARHGDAAVTAVLEDLERVLVEVASSPSPAPRDDIARWRDQIASTELLFKIGATNSRIRALERDAAPTALPDRKSAL